MNNNIIMDNNIIIYSLKASNRDILLPSKGRSGIAVFSLSATTHKLSLIQVVSSLGDYYYYYGWFYFKKL